jgi:hypothetical protein
MTKPKSPCRGRGHWAFFLSNSFQTSGMTLMELKAQNRRLGLHLRAFNRDEIVIVLKMLVNPSKFSSIKGF